MAMGSISGQMLKCLHCGHASHYHTWPGCNHSDKRPIRIAEGVVSYVCGCAEFEVELDEKSSVH